MSESTVHTSGAVSHWARDVVATEAPLPAPASGTAVRRRLAALGAAMVAGPIAMTAWFLVEPSVLPREEARVFLESVASSPSRYLVATIFVALAGALAIPAAMGVATLLRPRLPKLGLVVGVLTALSGLGLCAQVGFRAFVWSLVDAGSVPATSVESYTLFQEAGVFDVLLAPGLVLGGVSTLLLVGCLVRTRIVPLWVPVAVIVGMVLASGEFADPVTVTGAALGAVANLRLARALLALVR